MGAVGWGLVAKNWFLKFPGTKVFHLPCNSLNHLALFINLTGLEMPARRKIFRFEEMWLSNVRCGETVEAMWTNTVEPNSDSPILRKIAKCEKDLTW